jgi:hypothetical protein
MLYESKINQLIKDIEQDKLSVISHPLYKNLRQLSDIRLFTEYHVFAVWDFMSLVKYLQQNLTCISIPWKPIANPELRYFINEIVCGEESDVDLNGNRMSHFELYLNAMTEMGANTLSIQNFLKNLELDGLNKTLATFQEKDKLVFTQLTFDVIQLNKPHVAAAVFTFGREDLIPEMFLQIVNNLPVLELGSLKLFKYYIERHIEIDGNLHSNLALEMTKELCANDNNKWEEAKYWVKKSLQARKFLWDNVNSKICSSVLN